MSSLTKIMSGITIVTFNGDPGISTIAADLQKLADHDGTPIAALYNTVPLMAMPGGDSKMLVEGYYEIKPKSGVSYQTAFNEFANGGGYAIEYDTIPTPMVGLTKLPNFIEWVRSLKLPGEFNL